MKAKYSKSIKLSIPFIVLGAILFANRPCDTACIKQRISNHKARRQFYWNPFLQKPLNERIVPAPKTVVRLINLDNKLNGYPEGTKPAQVSKSLRKEIIQAISELPKSIRTYLEKNLAGILFTQKLGGSGYTDVVMDKEHDKAVAAYIVLDTAMLNQNANEWMSFKESTPFSGSTPYKIQGVLASESENNRKNALQWLLLHEIGHVIGALEKPHPGWWGKPEYDTSQYEYFNISWVSSKEKGYTPKENSDFLNRDKMKYYFGAKLQSADIKLFYSNLAKSTFITPYAATNPYDDFADSFAAYVHMKIMKKPFSINVLKKDTISFSYRPCWGQPRCQEKEIVLDELYKKLAL